MRNNKAYRSNRRSDDDAVSGLIGTLCGGALAILCYAIIRESGQSASLYGYGLFIVVPVFAGFTAGLYAFRKSVDETWRIWHIALWIYLCVTLLLLVFVLEGIVCMLMAFPIAYPCMALGARLGCYVQSQFGKNKPMMVSIVPMLPIIAVSTCFHREPVVHQSESTELVIKAPKEAIWPYLFNLKTLEAPKSLVLRTGVAYPTEVCSEANTVGAKRECVLSTGTMTEIVTEVEPFKRLRFDVVETPPPLKETNPFGQVHAPHEHGYFDVEWGEFQLIDLGNGRTRLIGTSRYRYNLFPAWYWGLINNTVVEQVHRRVMEEIKRRCESRSEPAPAK
ncbi:MAG: hypothetical protein GC165_10615 [Armatimonadetes bacterium]|nr:hypothetical protein [Armatimonadota bacterium]